MDIVIKNGTIVTAYDIFKADIGVTNGKIVAIGEELDGNENIDSTGKYVFPGLVDVNTHFEKPFGNTRSIDNFWTGSRSAVCGGVTTFIDVAVQNHGESLSETISQKKNLADPQIANNYSLHLSITHLAEETLKELAEIVNTGVPTLQLYMASPVNNAINDGQLLAILSVIANSGGMVGIHCENAAIFDYLSQKYQQDNKLTPEYYPNIHPAFSEAEAAHRAISFANEVAVNLCLFGVSCKETLARLTWALNEGHEIYAGTAPHYLTHSADKYKTLEAANYLTYPPLREADDIKALWKAIRRGDIQFVASGHCAFTTEQKKLGITLNDIPIGVGGVETLLPVMHTEGVVGKRINLMQLVAILSSNPAKIFGLQNKGSISVGKDADLVIFNPMDKKIITASTLHSESDYTIYEGLEVQGYPEVTICNGQIVYERGKFMSDRGAGNFIERTL